MATKEKSAPRGGSMMSELLFQAGLYKRSQGKVTRQVTFAVLAISVAVAAWQLHQGMTTYDLPPVVEYLLPLAIVAAGVWISYRVVNLSRFADFLISVEAEMNKVSWPSRTELIRSSIVVIVVMLFLAAMLFLYDTIWRVLFVWLGVMHG